MESSSDFSAVLQTELHSLPYQEVSALLTSATEAVSSLGKRRDLLKAQLQDAIAASRKRESAVLTEQRGDFPGDAQLIELRRQVKTLRDQLEELPEEEARARSFVHGLSSELEQRRKLLANQTLQRQYANRQGKKLAAVEVARLAVADAILATWADETAGMGYEPNPREFFHATLGEVAIAQLVEKLSGDERARIRADIIAKDKSGRFG